MITKKTKITNDNENNEILRKKGKLRNITNDNENNEILRKKGKYFKKNHVIVIFYAKTVYFFIHLKNIIIAFFLFFLLFRFFRFYSLFMIYNFFTK